MPNGNSLFNADRNTEETAFVHAFTNSKSKWVQKCERFTFEDEEKEIVRNKLKIYKWCNYLRKNESSSKRRKHLEAQMEFQSNRQLTTDDITAKWIKQSKQNNNKNLTNLFFQARLCEILSTYCNFSQLLPGKGKSPIKQILKPETTTNRKSYYWSKADIKEIDPTYYFKVQQNHNCKRCHTEKKSVEIKSNYKASLKQEIRKIEQEITQ